ncbi:MAG: MOSC N-terminal beta barrel domain-containing protein [Chloroflexota bacterium]
MSELTVGYVKALFRYPVKSMQGETVSSVEIGRSGVVGDRTYGLRLPNGRIATAKRSPSLLRFHASSHANSSVSIQLPSGERIDVHANDASQRLSDALGKTVTIEQWNKEQQNFGELDAKTIFADVPPEVALEGKRRKLAPGTEEYDLAPGTFFDSAHLHILTTGTLKHLGKLLQGQSNLDVHRFRPNILIESAKILNGFVEDDWIDKQLLIGDVVIGEIWPTLRCVMMTLPQRDLPKDTKILRTIVKRHANHLGIFADAKTVGTIRLGDSVRLVSKALE